MNSTTYLKTIVNNFGGVKGDELQEKLIKLVNLAKSEEKQIYIQKPRESKEPEPQEKPDMKLYRNPEDVFDTNYKDYQKVEYFIKSIRVFHPGKWFKVSIIPAEYWELFVTCYQNPKYEIYFNEELHPDDEAEFRVMEIKTENKNES